MTHLFCQDATGTLLKLTQQWHCCLCCLKRSAIQKQAQSSFHMTQAPNAGSTYQFCTGRSPGLTCSGANMQTCVRRSIRNTKSNPMPNTLQFCGKFFENFPFNFTFAEKAPTGGGSQDNPKKHALPVRKEQR